MAKRSQRRPLRNEKDQAGCIWGLINIFDFRHGRSTRKLLADRRRGNRQGIGAEFPRPKLVQPDSSVKCQDTEDGSERRMVLPDTVKTTVKKLMEEEMFNDQGLNKQINDSEVRPKIFDAECGSHTRKNHKVRNRIGKKSNDIQLCDFDAAKDLKPEKSSDHVQTQKASDNIDLEIIIQELCQIHQKNCSCVEHLPHDDSSDVQLDQAGTVDKEKLTAAIKVFADQNLCKSKHSREDGQVQQSREFIDALHKVSSNKDLLLKFLQDPNSLWVKQIKGLEETQLEKDPDPNPLPQSVLLEEKLTRSKTDDFINQKPRKFFRRRSKSQEHFPMGENGKCQSSSKIVILKPGPATLRQPDTEISVGSSMPSHYPIDNKIHGEKNQFSFTEIKRKLKQAIRKEKQDISPDGIIQRSRPENQKRRDFDKGLGGENVGWCSPNRNHFFTERFAKPSMSFKRAETINKPNPTEGATANDHLKPRVSNIYLEAKKHLLEMLSIGDDNAELMSQKFPKSLGRILSFPEYNYSPIYSPRKNREETLGSTPVRFSPGGTIQSVNESVHQLVEEKLDGHPSPSKQRSESLPCLPCENSEEVVESANESESVPYNHYQANSVEETLSTSSDVIISEGAVEIEETTNTVCKEDNENPLANTVCKEDNENPLAPCDSSTSASMRDAKIGYATEECDEHRLPQSLKMESFVESQMLSSPSASPSHSSVTMKVEDSEDAIDRKERPSPVSVLDPLFAEDDISPARTISTPVELEIEPRQIHFEEQKSSSDHGICIRTSLEVEESAFEYVEAVLLGSGLNWDEYLSRWLSSYPILDSMLYDEVELFSSRSRIEQKLLFDSTNEVLGEICDCYFGSFIGMSCRKQNMHPIPKAMDLILEIWKGVEWHLLHYPPPQSLDQLARKDMAKSRAWMDLRADTEHIGKEMENAILETLIEDAISSFICDTSDSNFVVLPAHSSEIQS